MSFQTTSTVERLQIKLLRVRYSLTGETLRLTARRFRSAALRKTFDPNRPRVPAGNPEGGEWTSTGAGGGGSRTRLAAAEEDDNPRRSLLEETLDGAAEVRVEEFHITRREIQRLEPANRRLAYAAPPDYVPDREAIDDVRNELEAARDRVSARIARGHAFAKHAQEFGVNSPAELQSIARAVISDPRVQVRDLTRGRTAFYYRPKNILVIVDPSARDNGTIFRPTRGQPYVDTELKTGGNSR